MEASGLDRFEQDGESPHEPRRGDPPERLSLAHAELALAEVEHRRTRGFEMKAALLHLAEIRHHLREQARSSIHAPRSVTATSS